MCFIAAMHLLRAERTADHLWPYEISNRNLKVRLKTSEEFYSPLCSNSFQRARRHDRGLRGMKTLNAHLSYPSQNHIWMHAERSIGLYCRLRAFYWQSRSLKVCTNRNVRWCLCALPYMSTRTTCINFEICFCFCNEGIREHGLYTQSLRMRNQRAQWAGLFDDTTLQNLGNPIESVMWVVAKKWFAG